MNRDDMDEAIEYAGLIAEICKLTRPNRDAERKVFDRLGWETTINKRGYCMRQPGESHWQSMPHILTDFGTAVHFTIGHRHGALEAPLESNWFITRMGETEVPPDSGKGRIAAWAVELAKINKERKGHVAIAITPAAALVAAWLRAHP